MSDDQPVTDGDSAIAGALHEVEMWSAGPADPASVGYSAIEGFDLPEEER